MNRLAAETSPYLLQHAENPVDWYPWGPEALERARERGEADPALGRLQRLPLVPRDGARVVRERGHGGADERALRQRQGRPRGAARRRRALHGRDRLDDRAGRLADDRLPHAGGRAVLRRHVLPAGAAARAAVVRPAPARGRRGLGDAAGRHRHAGATARRGGEPLGPDRAVRRAAHGGAARRGRARDRAHLRARLRRLRPGAEVPARLDARVPPPPRLAGGDGDGDEDARRDGRRRDVRPRRRRLPPLLGRRAVARAALREDALRQRAARRRPTCTPAVVTGEPRYRAIVEETLDYMVRELRLPDGGLASAQDADTNGVEGLTFTWTEEEGVPAELLQPFEHGRSIIRGSLDPGAPRAGCSPSASCGRSRGSTTRCSPRGTGSRSRRSPRARAGSSAPTGSRRRVGVGEFLLGPLSREDGRLSRSWRDGEGQRRGLPRRLRERRARPARAPRRDGRAALAARGAPARAARRRAVPRSRARRLLPRPDGRRGARRPHEGPRRQPDPVRQLDARARAAAARPDLGRRRARAPRRLGAAARGADARPRAGRLRLGALRARPLARAAARDRDRRAGRQPRRARRAGAVRAEHGRRGRARRRRAAARGQGPRRREAGGLRLRAVRLSGAGDRPRELRVD